MSASVTSYLSPKAEVRSVYGDQLGVFAREFIAKDEVIAVWGGEIFTGSGLAKLPRLAQQLSIQVEEDLYLTSIVPSDADRVNHSCDPNAGLNGQIVLLAMRDIEPDEQICFDYAMSDGSPYDEFECQCGSPLCRGHITGQDWQLPELQERYAGYFSSYIQRRIERMHALRSV